jgi:hypothetical protein
MVYETWHDPCFKVIPLQGLGAVGVTRQPQERKGEAAMRSTVRQISVILLLVALLAPGLLQARTPVRRSAHTTQSTQTVKTPGFLITVWNLLTNGLLLKNGGQMDPLGSTSTSTTTSSSTTTDNGGQMDPVGGTP